MPDKAEFSREWHAPSHHTVVNFRDIVHFPWASMAHPLAKIKGLGISGTGLLSEPLNEEEVG